LISGRYVGRGFLGDEIGSGSETWGIIPEKERLAFEGGRARGERTKKKGKSEERFLARKVD